MNAGPRTLRFPAQLPVEQYVGAAGCAGCHPDQYAAWRESPHGRAMAVPSEASVLAPFEGVQRAGSSTITLRNDRGRYSMVVDEVSYGVDLVLASGRQHQVYLTETDDGQYQFLPLIWATPTQTWVPIDLYRKNALAPGHASHWTGQDITFRGRCMNCHLSQMSMTVTSSLTTRWVDLSVNCEACHGPGRPHVESRVAGDEETDPYADLHALSKTADLRLCSQCHAAKLNFHARGKDGHHDYRHLFASLADRGLRVDGTQFSTTYQYAGHALSPCYTKGAMACSSCHAPHSGSARDLVGQSAERRHSDRQCVVCHRDYRGKEQEHSFHDSSVSCVDCHMSRSWIIDDPATVQETSDHSISVPNPTEAKQFGIPNACTKCHAEKKPEWAERHLVSRGRIFAVRDWIPILSAARRGQGSAPALASLLAENYPDIIKVSALELLAEQVATPTVVAALERLVKSASAASRARALVALMHHDRENTARWRRHGLSDADPFVRTLVFEYAPNAAAYSETDLQNYLADLLEYSRIPPLDALDLLAQIRTARGEPRAALDVVELRLRMSSARAEGRGEALRRREELRRRIARER